jgi:hypothetical protein
VAAADTFTVTTLDDSGAGSLREAIVAAAGDTGASTITFDGQLAGGVIGLVTPLPPLPADTTVDGDLDDDCVPDIGLDGGGLGGSGLEIQSTACTVRGLAITGIGGSAVRIATAAGSPGVTVVECCHLGMRLDGTTAGGNSGYGVEVGSAAAGAIIGPDNLIAYNDRGGVGVWESSDDGAYPEFDGLTPAATLRFPVIDFPLS